MAHHFSTFLKSLQFLRCRRWDQRRVEHIFRFWERLSTSSPISCIFVRGACATCNSLYSTWHTRILTCIAHSNVTGSVRVELMLGGQGFASGATYHSHPDTRVDAVSPAQVPTEGGTRVAIHGDGFSYRAALLVLMVCRFSSKGGADVNAAATFETVSAVFCLTPTAAAGTTRVEVANNGHDFTDDGFHRIRECSAAQGDASMDL